ncbi:PD-(D/E)XK nuclease family protein [Paenibacillus sp. NEAU-GSW1]|uniref:PDDEXK-like family protein n=1 Tax=Paenibacillus sp. NEAU-GSW1 TaxID=2682486 RepID=UPI0012E0D45D|nr:PD-(D/E)XK nuclease family protein [Paenibacillus sp. NEAU-GSW1]MUT65225.1 hypothetical protein [Paenibacillus sp. NEAU-GSW1]
MNNDQDIFQQINRFVVNNQMLEQLESKINEFNPFSVLKVDHFEIRHSNILAWLLNPKDNHFLGDLVLKKITAEVLCGAVQIANHNLQVSDILLGSLHDAEILREWRNIDILVVSKKNDFVFFIENKVHAGLAEHQLQKYLQIVKETYPNVKHIIPVYLTLHGDEAPNPEYYSLGHCDILNILKSILDLHNNNMNAKIFDFIHYYTQTLEVLTMQDEQLIKLCKEIYKHHKDAIETIIKYGVTSISTLNQAVEVLKDDLKCIGHGEDAEFFLSDTQYWFIPDTFDQWLPRLTQNWRSPRPITYFFAAEENRLRLILEVGPISDGHLRLQVLNHIVDHDHENLFSIKANALKKVDGSFNKIRTKSIEISDWSDSDHVVERMKKLVEHEFKYHEVNQALQTIFQNFNLGNANDKI